MGHTGQDPSSFNRVTRDVDPQTHFGATLGSFDRILKEASVAAEMDNNVKREKKKKKNGKRKLSFRRTFSSFSSKSNLINRKNVKRSFSWIFVQVALGSMI